MGPKSAYHVRREGVLFDQDLESITARLVKRRQQQVQINAQSIENGHFRGFGTDDHRHRFLGWQVAEGGWQVAVEVTVNASGTPVVHHVFDIVVHCFRLQTK